MIVLLEESGVNTDTCNCSAYAFTHLKYLGDCDGCHEFMHAEVHLTPPGRSPAAVLWATAVAAVAVLVFHFGGGIPWLTA